jgi:hypothetical protein
MLHANLVAGGVELALLLLALHMGSIEMVAAAVLIAYISQAIVYLPYLRRDLSVGLWAILARIWPVAPALGVGWLTTNLLPSSFGATVFTLAIRGMFTAAVVGLTHGLLSRFRCFHEVGGMISQNFANEVTIP